MHHQKFGGQNIDGSDEKLISKDGTFPTFSADGQRIFFERGRKSLISVSLEGSDEKQIFPSAGSEFEKYAVVKPRVSPDKKFVAFTSDRNGRWNAWLAALDSQESEHIAEGCEPAWLNNENLVWVSKANTKAKSGISLFNRSTKERLIFQDDGPPLGHEYFPTLVGNSLLYSACSYDKHSHNEANYQLFFKDLETNQVYQLTNNNFTNRWAKLYPSNSHSAPRRVRAGL